MDIFIARQPIFDINKNIIGYELLFRDRDFNNISLQDPDKATSHIISNSFENTKINMLAEDNRVFINFTSDLIKNNVASLFPKEKLVIEITKDISIDNDIVESIEELKSQGYTIVLDYFIFDDELYMKAVNYADMIKIDFIKYSDDEIKKILSKINSNNIKFIALKVETIEDYEIAKELGFTYFQGFFFAKPQIVKQKIIEPRRLSLLRLLQQVNKKDLDIDALSTIISQDSILSYRLLKLVNSVVYGVKHKINSVNHALLMLGEIETRKWVSLIVLKGISGDENNEIIKMSYLRAKFLEHISTHTKFKSQSEDLFLLGLFSLLDVILRSSFEAILDDLPVSTNIKNALIHKQGEYIPFLNIITNYEKGEFNKLEKIIKEKNIDNKEVIDAYIKAVKWSDEVNVS